MCGILCDFVVVVVFGVVFFLRFLLNQGMSPQAVSGRVTPASLGRTGFAGLGCGLDELAESLE